jgi:hypothetical protein
MSSFYAAEHSRRLDCRLHWITGKRIYLFSSFNFIPIFSIYELEIFTNIFFWHFSFLLLIFFVICFEQNKKPNTPYLSQNNLLNFSGFSVFFYWSSLFQNNYFPFDDILENITFSFTCRELFSAGLRLPLYFHKPEIKCYFS